MVKVLLTKRNSKYALIVSYALALRRRPCGQRGARGGRSSQHPTDSTTGTGTTTGTTTAPLFYTSTSSLPRSRRTSRDDTRGVASTHTSHALAASRRSRLSLIRRGKAKPPSRALRGGRATPPGGWFWAGVSWPVTAVRARTGQTVAGHAGASVAPPAIHDKHAQRP